MNNKNILDLTLRLSQALDQNYDVVSMDTVLSVISALEGTTITKEQLEATRLAKYINQLRRRTNCENLARRAKSLLKRWREMVGIQQQQQNTSESSVSLAPLGTSARPVTSTITSSTATASFNTPVSDNAVSTSYLANPQISSQHLLGHQFQSSVKQHQTQPYSQPTSPLNLQDKSNPNEFVISVSNPAPATNMSKSSNSNLRKKKRLEKASEDEKSKIYQQQPTSFANLLTGLGGYNTLSSFSSTRKTFRDKGNNMATSMKPVETYVIEHSSNSNSDLICLPSNTTLGSNITSETNVPPIVIDLQDTNSSMTSLVSKDVTNASFSAVKQTSKKSKKERKRKERDMMFRQTQPLQDCDENNTSTVSYYHKRPSEMLSVDEKSQSACPTISNISEILSLSNSSMSSVFPSVDGISKNTYVQAQSALPSSSGTVKKSDLTFAGKFKQITSSSSTGCDILNYSNDDTNINLTGGNSPKKNKFSVFGGSEATNSNDSSSSSRTMPFSIAVNTSKHEISSNSKQNEEDATIKQDINEKSMSNLSIKGNSSTDNVASAAVTSTITTLKQQSIDLTTTDLSLEKNIKQPKKRGRKKGSRGVDSVIAKEASLSSQMLISSLSAAGKKVKTTKELYAEMENRKLRNVKSAGISNETVSSSQQIKSINSPRTPYCSDIAESDSCTMTSEPSRDSSGIPLKTVGKREMPLDSNSNYSQHGSDVKITDICGEGTTSTTFATNSSFLAITLKLKQELQEILKHLPPPPSKEEIEGDCLNNTTPCTCVIEEVGASDESNCNDDSGEQIAGTNLSASNNIFKNDKKEVQTEQMTNITEDKFLSEKQRDFVDQPPPSTKPKKSIFDLDFDDDEDPLNSIIADIVGKSTKENDGELVRNSETTIPTTEINFVLPQKDEHIFDINNVEKDHSADIDVPPPSAANAVVIPSYKVKYDSECEARNRFEIQTQKITKFHVNTLHNCFIPNVNGNWNHADVVTNNLSITKNVETNDHLGENFIDGYDVVPFYSSEIKEKIVKDLSHIKFTTKFEHKCWNSQNEILFHIPFMGVSRLPDILKVKFHKTDCLIEEEKENIDDKSNLSNFSAVKNCLESEHTDAKDLKQVPIKIKKRLKKSATSQKCAKTKRIKLSINGESQCGFDDISCANLQDKNDTSQVNLEDSITDSDIETDEHSIDGENFKEKRTGNNEPEKMEVNVYQHEGHDISDNSNDHNHIVTTIKKTPSKTSSPLNTLPNLSPVYADINEDLNSAPNREMPKTATHEEQNREVDANSLKKEDDIDGFLSSDENFFVKLKRMKSHKPSESSANFKLHNSLFYHEEVRPLVKHGTQLYRESIFQISSCSSSCSADEETISKPPLILRRRVRSISSSSSSSSSSSNSFIEKNDDKYDGLTLSIQQDFIVSEFKKRTINASTDNIKSSPKSLHPKLDFQQLGANNDSCCGNDDDDLPAENNLMLVSFNHIYSSRDGNSTYLNNEQLNKRSDEGENNLLKQQHQNCDDSNLNNNFNLIKYIENKSSVSNNIINNNNNNSSIINYLDTNITLRGNCKISSNHDKDDNKSVKFQEYQSGIRAVDEDVNDEQGNNCARLQEFKEWHEVLQLRSYNDELLTVLPYVVLD